MQSYQSSKTKCGVGGAVVGGVGGVGGVALALASVFCFNPVSWALLGVCGLSAMAEGAAGYGAGIGAHWVCDAERGKAFGKKKSVGECKVSLPFTFPVLTLHMNYHVPKTST